MESVRGYLNILPEAKSYGAVLQNKGIPCPYVCLSGDEVDHLSSWVLIEKDLLISIEAFNNAIEKQKAKNSEEGIIGQSLLFAGIITYAKCFAEARGRSISLKQKEKEVFLKDIVRLETHKLMMKLRNQYIAHGDQTEHEKVDVRAALNPDVSNKQFITVYHVVFATAQINIEMLQKFLETSTTVLDYVRSQIKKMHNHLNQEVDSMSIKDLYEKAVFVNL